ncbi:type II toxin-antitoxin system death-on-curing family toxin [Candidatus Protochlamydia phocaeensis]|uniref:type II toxin-antitoxin system death-on-curing family toxin n=1 Tax=Candidatus Protochlamydia phocaeensis TaxID=1414722 RepID=UPI000AE82348|nr:type II toxin-antitoxin system death-on-curing family toxin [Candidatus Protochlamydia phocaeensis]
MIKFLPVEMIILYHDKLIDSYGGVHGIRDMGLLLSALEMPKAHLFGVELHPTLEDKAAAYLFHIICNHPFIDGNKRTGGFVAAVFLEINGKSTDFPDEAYESLILGVARGEMKKEDISRFFKRHPSN